MNRTLWALFLTFIAPFATVAQQWPEAKVTVHVVDEERRPMANVDVGITFDEPTYKPGKWGSSDVLTRSGKTNNEGLFSAAEPSGNYVNSGAKAPGYYNAHGEPVKFWKTEGRKWQPWNPAIELVLKKIINPIPMYARRVNRAVPAQNEDLGFDMFVGDFVTPYGQGKTADMIFRLEVTERTKKDYDYKLTVAFPNTADGILPFNPTSRLQGSALRSPYSAPEKGFLPSWTVTRSRRPGSAENSNYDPEKHGYFFRIRSSVDKSGKILSAYYGKIYGDFMNFTYYLNPTPNDRNIEFDPKRNLFTNLKDDERVTAP
jgi:hypothetical protein